MPHGGQAVPHSGSVKGRVPGSTLSYRRWNRLHRRHAQRSSPHLVAVFGKAEMSPIFLSQDRVTPVTLLQAARAEWLNDSTSAR